MQPDGADNHRSRILLAIAFALSVAGYAILAYFTSRIEFTKLLIVYFFLSVIYFWILTDPSKKNLTVWLVAALLLRAVFLVAVPELSDDYFRFIWDGRLWNQGIHPFAFLPKDLISQNEFAAQPINQVLYNGLNSPEYFTVYPPISQLVFFCSTFLFPDDITANLIFMRLIIMVAEAGSIFFLPKILEAFKKPLEWSLIYAWNPLVILELTGNLHFEAIMIFFLLTALWYFKRERYNLSAITMGLAIGTKLIPLIFLPLLWDRLPPLKMVRYCLWVGAVVLLCFLPILNLDMIRGLSSGLGLYFEQFEFNASIFYLIREIGFIVKGYNIIKIAGTSLAIITLVLIIWLAWRSGNRLTWPQAMAVALTIYLFLATTVHPWYLASLVILCAFTHYRYPLVWAFLIILSYAGYSYQGYHENLGLVFLQYCLVWIVLIAELKGWRLPPNLFGAKSVYRNT